MPPPWVVPTWASSYVLNPANEPSIIHKPESKCYVQPTFHIHKPTHWFRQNGVYQRVAIIEGA